MQKERETIQREPRPGEIVTMAFCFLVNALDEMSEETRFAIANFLERGLKQGETKRIRPYITNAIDTLREKRFEK